MPGITHNLYQIMYMFSNEPGTETIHGRNFIVNHIRKNLNKLYRPKVAHAATIVLSEELKSD